MFYFVVLRLREPDKEVGLEKNMEGGSGQGYEWFALKTKWTEMTGWN